MKAGVSMAPWGVTSRPSRAAEPGMGYCALNEIADIIASRQ
jgi:hypothetical protein